MTVLDCGLQFGPISRCWFIIGSGQAHSYFWCMPNTSLRAHLEACYSAASDSVQLGLVAHDDAAACSTLLIRADVRLTTWSRVHTQFLQAPKALSNLTPQLGEEHMSQYTKRTRHGKLQLSFSNPGALQSTEAYLANMNLHHIENTLPCNTAKRGRVNLHGVKHTALSL